MSDVARWKVHGSIETLRTELAEWDGDQETWQPARCFTLTSFRPDGSVSSSETHSRDGSFAHQQWLYGDTGRLTESTFLFNDGPVQRTMYTYDEAGRHVRTVHLSSDGTQTDTETCTYDAEGKRTKLCFLGLHGTNVCYGIEGTEHSYGAPGATTMATAYDEKDLPSKVIFQDANHDTVASVILVRDGAGRILREEMRLGGESMLTDHLNNASPEERESLLAMFQKLFGDAFSSTTYVYDSQGRLLERTNRMGGLQEDRTTYHYDGHDDPVEETTESKGREASADEAGILHYTSDRMNVQHNRFEYRYDTHGNWTERIASFRLEANEDFRRSNIERRAITYHAVVNGDSSS